MKFVAKKDGNNGTRYAVIAERRGLFAVCWRDAYTWKYVQRYLTIDKAIDLMAAKAV